MECKANNEGFNSMVENSLVWLSIGGSLKYEKFVSVSTKEMIWICSVEGRSYFRLEFKIIKITLEFGFIYLVSYFE